MLTLSEGLRDRVAPLLVIGIGGFAGAALRHALAQELPVQGHWATLVANVGGAFLLGLLLSEGHLRRLLSPETRLLVGTGFCSSLTTYSTFALETTELDAGLALVYVVLTYALGFGAILLGQAVTRWSR